MFPRENMHNKNIVCSTLKQQALLPSYAQSSCCTYQETGFLPM